MEKNSLANSKMHIFRLKILSFAFFALLAASLAYADDISACQLMNTANKEYVLTASIVSGYTCFNITASNVTINCAGFSLTGGNHSETYGIHINGSGLTLTNFSIENCTIHNYSAGIFINGTENATIRNVTVNTSLTAGSVHYGYGIWLSNSNNSRIINSSANSSGYSSADIGIYIESANMGGTQNNSIINSTATAATGYGLYLSGANYTNITNSMATEIIIFASAYSNVENTSATSTSITIDNMADFNNLTNCSAIGGISITSSSSYNIVTNCTGYNTGAGHGFTIGSNYNNFTNCIGEAAGTGKGISLTSSYNIVSNSRGIGASSYGMQVLSTYNRIENSIATSTSSYGIYVNQNYNNITNLTAFAPVNRGMYIHGADYNNIRNSSFYSGSNTGIYGSSTANDNNFTDLVAGSNTSAAIFMSGDRNYFANCTGTTNSTGYGAYFSSTDYSTIDNSTFKGETYGLYIYSLGYMNVTNCTIVANSTYSALRTDLIRFSIFKDNWINGSDIPAIEIESGGAAYNNSFINNTLLSGANTTVRIGTYAYNNTFYWNNFTNSSGMFVNDTNGSNFYNYSANGTNMGNIWFNIINGSVTITGSTTTPWSGLYYGSAGSDYPYSNNTSYSKVSSGVIDYAPLTSSTGSNTAPNTPTLNSPANNSNFTVSYVLLNTTVNDTEGDSMTVYFFGNGSIISTNTSIADGSTVLFNWTGLTDGTYNWSITAADGSTNNSSSAYIFTIDTSGPNITINSPTESSSTSDTNITFSWTASDRRKNITCNFSFGGEMNRSNLSVTNGTAYSTYLNDINNLSEGNYNWSVTCWDDLNNSASSGTYNFSVSTSTTITPKYTEPEGGGKPPFLSKNFECETGLLTITAQYSSTPVIGISIKIFETGNGVYSTSETNSKGEAVFTIASGGKYAAESIQTSQWYAAYLSSFDLELCIPEPVIPEPSPPEPPAPAIKEEQTPLQPPLIEPEPPPIEKIVEPEPKIRKPEIKPDEPGEAGRKELPPEPKDEPFLFGLALLGVGAAALIPILIGKKLFKKKKKDDGKKPPKGLATV